MTLFLVSPAEPLLIRALGTTSAVPEKLGADIVWADRTLGGTIGVQRKVYTDLIASEDDGRLTKELLQLPQCRMAFLIVEGRPTWTVDGMLNHQHLGYWSREGYRSLLRSVQTRGVIVEHSDDEADTISLIESIAKWIAKGTHRSLDRRPKAGTDRWGQKTHRGTQAHILQSVDGIGPAQANAILDHFGELPLQWSVGEDDLKAVRGLGPKKVKAMVAAIGVAG